MDLRKRLKDNSSAPKEGMEPCQKKLKKTKLHSISLIIVCFCFLFCTSDVGSIQQMSHLLEVECGIHGQENTNRAVAN